MAELEKQVLRPKLHTKSARFLSLVEFRQRMPIPAPIVTPMGKAKSWADA
jgi:hypothetical protein